MQYWRLAGLKFVSFQKNEILLIYNTLATFNILLSVHVRYVDV